MDYLKSLIGGKKSETSLLGTSQDNQPQEKNDSENINSKSTEVIGHNNNNSSQIELAPSLDKWDSLEKSLRDAAKRVIPLKDDDCLSCKLIGTTVLWGCSAIVLRGGFKFRKTQTGYKKVTSLIGYSTFAFGLFLIGTARLCDLSIFDEKTDKSLGQMVLEDFNNLKQTFSKISERKE